MAATDYSKMSDADLAAELAKYNKPAATDYSKMSDADLAALHAKVMNGQPSVAAIGTPDGAETPAASEGFGNRLKRYGVNTIHGVAKGLSYARDATTAPLEALAMEGATGKKLFTGQEYLDALNPTTTKTFPNSDELMKRAGVQKGDNLSDHMDMYAKPGPEVPWYQPEKGGMLDPSMRGSIGFVMDTATDPLTYLSFGASAAAKKALSEGATRAVAEQAAKSAPKNIVQQVLEKAGGAVDRAGGAVNSAGEKIYNALPGAAQNAADTVVPKIAQAVNLPSYGLDQLGKLIYGTGVRKMEQEGAQYGKMAVGDTLYNSGIASPFNLTEKTAQVANNLKTARDKILTRADQSGVKVPMGEAIEPAQEAIAKIRQVKDPEAQALAERMDRMTQAYPEIEAGKPGIPGTPDISMEVPKNTGILDEFGKPIMRTEEKVIPGRAPIEGTPGSPYSPTDATRLKTWLYNGLPTGHWNEVARSAPGAEVKAQLARGMKEGTENAVAQGLGPKAAQDLIELNDSLGKTLTTKPSTRLVQKQAERDLDAIANPTRTSQLVGMLLGAKGMAMNAAGHAARLSTMPIGYSMRKTAENPLTSTLLNNYMRRKVINNGSNKPGDQNGQN